VSARRAHLYAASEIRRHSAAPVSSVRRAQFLPQDTALANRAALALRVRLERKDVLAAITSGESACRRAAASRDRVSKTRDSYPRPPRRAHERLP
jgi:hypothetical protein